MYYYPGYARLPSYRGAHGKQGINSCRYPFTTPGLRETIVDKMPCLGAHALSGTEWDSNPGSADYESSARTDTLQCFHNASIFSFYIGNNKTDTHTHTHTHRNFYSTLWRWVFISQLVNYYRKVHFRNKIRHCVLLFECSHKVLVQTPHTNTHTHTHTHTRKQGESERN